MLSLPCQAWIAVFFVACVCSSLEWVEHGAALAQDNTTSDQVRQSWYETLRTQPTLITRPWLSEYGIAFSGEVTQFAFGVAGGINNKAVTAPFGQGDTVKYTGRGEYDVKFDLDKLVGLPVGSKNLIAPVAIPRNVAAQLREICFALNWVLGGLATGLE